MSCGLIRVPAVIPAMAAVIVVSVWGAETTTAVRGDVSESNGAKSACHTDEERM